MIFKIIPFQVEYRRNDLWELANTFEPINACGLVISSSEPRTYLFVSIPCPYTCGIPQTILIIRFLLPLLNPSHPPRLSQRWGNVHEIINRFRNRSNRWKRRRSHPLSWRSGRTIVVGVVLWGTSGRYVNIHLVLVLGGIIAHN
jgi:hypothetical protein